MPVFNQGETDVLVTEMAKTHPRGDGYLGLP